MKDRIVEWFSGKGSWKESLVLVLLGLIIILAAHFTVTLVDNLPGALAMFMGAVLIALAIARRFAHKNTYTVFAIGSLIGFFVFTVLHNVFEGLHAATAEGDIVGWIYQLISVTSFLLGILLMPALLIVGIAGLLITAKREEQAPPP